MPTFKSLIDKWFSNHLDDREEFNLDTDYKIFDLARCLRDALLQLDTTGVPPAAGAPLRDNGLTGPTTPLVGEVCYISGNSTLSRARGNVLGTARAYGAFSATGIVCVNGVFPVLFEAGLTPTAGSVVYLSNTVAGRATTVAPTTPGQYIVILGILKDVTGYNSGTGSALSVNWQVTIPILIP